MIFRRYSFAIAVVYTPNPIEQRKCGNRAKELLRKEGSESDDPYCHGLDFFFRAEIFKIEQENDMLAFNLRDSKKSKHNLRVEWYKT